MRPPFSVLRSVIPGASRRRLAWLVSSLVMGALVLILLAAYARVALPGGQALDLAAGVRRTPTPAPAARAPTATATAGAVSIPPTPDPADRYLGWKLIWRDEFSGTKLDTSVWTVVSDAPGGFHHCCLNNTLNAWAPDDVSLVGGSLRLTTERRRFQGAAYTSGAVTTQGKVDFLYGRLEIRARLPRGNGLWPAFWLLPSNMAPGGGQAAYEVDMTEALGQDTHVDYMVDWVGGRHQYCQYAGPDFSADYHLYSFIWTPTSIAYLIDDVVRCEFHHGMPTTRMYLTLNTRIGGSWPIPPDASTVLPQYTDIDYVRLYSAVAPHTSWS